MKKKIVSILLAAAMTLTMTACSGTEEKATGAGGTESEGITIAEDADTTNSTDTPGETKETVLEGTETISGETNDTGDNTGSSDPVTIKVFSNLTDRKNGQGFVEQTLFEQYMSENSNITIEVEALDDEAYKTKFKAYASGSEMPDLVNIWGQPSFLDEVIQEGLLAELDTNTYADYGFLSGSLDGFSKDDKLYGLPRNTDVMAFYYNKALFEENGWKVPATYDDLITLAGEISNAGLIPCSMDGADKWPISIYYQDIVTKILGDSQQDVRTSVSTGDFSNPAYLEAAKLLQKSVEAGLFQNGFETTDYGTSMNLFANGQAAMFYMGSWEMSMATNQDVMEEVRNNIGVFMMPSVKADAGTAADIAAWNGGGYAVTEKSEVKAEAVKLLNYMFLPQNWSRIAWENGVCMSAQNYSDYLTGTETPVQLAFTDIIGNASSITGVTFNDLGNSEFKTTSEDLSAELAIGMVTPEDFISQLQSACKK
ncbi:extracellular solute-binding protein [uncultured Robinsoniella sp.]|uniref:extracellular solute-binding protein n=1 Tax=uncultured Robinsoniella sp. TaxID=904190 RepID=UPI00374E929A